jgi:hypothetical protein
VEGLAGVSLQPSAVGCQLHGGNLDRQYGRSSTRGEGFRYTFNTVKRIILLLLVTLSVIILSFAEDASFSRIDVPDSKGRQIKAVLTFSDAHQAVEVEPVKGPTVSIPYAEIYKFAYEYTKRHRVNEESIFSAAIGVGAVVMLTKSKSHWLEIDYREGDVPKSFVLRMDKRDYIHILDAVKDHTGKDAEVLGNADKR